MMNNKKMYKRYKVEQLIIINKLSTSNIIKYVKLTAIA
jgi:hypothetical protein